MVVRVINIPKSNQRGELDNDSKIRKVALRYGSSLILNKKTEKAIAMIFTNYGNPEFLQQHKTMSLNA